MFSLRMQVFLVIPRSSIKSVNAIRVLSACYPPSVSSSEASPESELLFCLVSFSWHSPNEQQPQWFQPLSLSLLSLLSALWVLSTLLEKELFLSAFLLDLFCGGNEWYYQKGWVLYLLLPMLRFVSSWEQFQSCHVGHQLKEERQIWTNFLHSIFPFIVKFTDWIELMFHSMFTLYIRSGCWILTSNIFLTWSFWKSACTLRSFRFCLSVTESRSTVILDFWTWEVHSFDTTPSVSPKFAVL